MTNMPFGAKLNYREYIENWARAFPTERSRLKSVVVQGDKAIAEFTGRGTHTGTLKGPTGDLPGPSGGWRCTASRSYRFRGDKLAEGRVYFDAFSLFTSLGVGAAAQGSAATATPSSRPGLADDDDGLGGCRRRRPRGVPCRGRTSLIRRRLAPARQRRPVTLRRPGPRILVAGRNSSSAVLPGLGSARSGAGALPRSRTHGTSGTMIPGSARGAAQDMRRRRVDEAGGDEDAPHVAGGMSTARRRQRAVAGSPARSRAR